MEVRVPAFIVARQMMNRLSMLVTPDGQWVLAGSDEFLAALGDPDPDYDATSFAVKNLGFIKFQILEQSLIEIELHPSTVELAALLAVQQKLLRSAVRLFRVKYFENSWHSEIFPAAELAVTRLSELCAPKFLPSIHERFLVEPQDFSKLYDAGDSPLQLFAQKWRMSFAHFDPSVISFAEKQQLLSRLIIVGVKLPDDDPVFRFIGDGHANWLDENYHFNAIGEKIGNQPDKDYGAWLTEFYKSVAQTGRPRYDYVTATIQRGNGTHVTRYERLLLPWKTSSDEVLVTLSSRGLPENSVSEEPSSRPESSIVRNSVMSS
ncbi:MAG: hypothetical protein WB611_04015 [Stellaceae bacterium]